MAQTFVRHRPWLDLRPDRARSGATVHGSHAKDLVIVAELLGHARLETTRGYTRPSAEDRTRALELLLVDQ